ncbi:FAD binding domain-containing protein [Phaeacidiphilus oryzae]|uniref:FAD binding domain-containing protein n=1 Tax=Phaeacidiphilus oryzae TaxID=348818 RepID=UPI00055EEC0D|nr:FAD binding domain-containing protein [Phaeacidiphilus oryzae]
MKPAAFSYHRARDLAGAVGLLHELGETRGEQAKPIAGGQSLVAMMNYRLARPAHLVDIARVPGLSGLTLGQDALRIGALTTHHEVEHATDAELGPFRVLREAMRWIGHPPIRVRGTVGGSLAHADATAEWCLLAVGLDAQVEAHGPGGTRTIPAADFLRGWYSTALDPDELVTAVLFPRPGAARAAVTEFALRHGDFAVVSALVDLDGGRVALGGVAPVPIRVPEAEAVLAAGGSYADCAEAAAAAVDPPSDARASSAHRRALSRNLVRAACEEAAAR